MYQYNPNLHVKIWLSNNPNVFMNLENQIRLIEMREINPKDTIHLVFDSTLLNQASIHALHVFCKEHHIMPLDAHLIQEKLKSENEHILYRFYEDEITHLNTGGNLAVASDILRWLSPIFQWGTYSDFDFPIDTSILPSSITTELPLILNIGSLKMGKKEFILANNDFVAIVDEAAAKMEIERVQNGLIEKLTHYDTDFVERTEHELNSDSFINRYLLKFMKNRSESLYIAKSKEIISSDTLNSSLKIRSYINEVMTDKNKFLNFNKINSKESHQEIISRLRRELQNQLNLVKYLFFNKEYTLIKRILETNDDKFLNLLMKKERELYIKSIVVCTTGPIQISNSLFGGYVVDKDIFREHIQPLSFNHYGLQKAFRSQNSIPLHENFLGMLKFLGVDDGELNDSSWLDTGKKLQASRTKELAARQKNLASSLPINILGIKHDIERYIQNMPKCSLLKQRETEDLEAVLRCFNEEINEFDIRQFKNVLLHIHRHKKNRGAKKLIKNLEIVCHEAVLFSIAKEKKIKFGSSSTQFHA